MNLCGGRWVGACYRINLSTLVKRTLTLVTSMEDLRLIKSGATALHFLVSKTKKKKKKMLQM